MIGALASAMAVLLATAGLAKLRRPAPAARMLGTAVPPLRVRGRVPLVRLAGVLEALVGVAVLATGARWSAALLGLAYLTFVAITLTLMRRGTTVSCGCFGTGASAAEAPVGAAHLVLNCLAVAAAAAAVVRPAGPLAGYADASPAVALTGLAQVVLLAGLAYLAITALPALATARRRLENMA